MGQSGRTRRNQLSLHVRPSLLIRLRTLIGSWWFPLSTASLSSCDSRTSLAINPCTKLLLFIVEPTLDRLWQISFLQLLDLSCLAICNLELLFLYLRWCNDLLDFWCSLSSVVLLPTRLIARFHNHGVMFVKTLNWLELDCILVQWVIFQSAIVVHFCNGTNTLGDISTLKLVFVPVRGYFWLPLELIIVHLMVTLEFLGACRLRCLRKSPTNWRVIEGQWFLGGT